MHESLKSVIIGIFFMKNNLQQKLGSFSAASALVMLPNVSSCWADDLIILTVTNTSGAVIVQGVTTNADGSAKSLRDDRAVVSFSFNPGNYANIKSSPVGQSLTMAAYGTSDSSFWHGTNQAWGFAGGYGLSIAISNNVPDASGKVTRVDITDYGPGYLQVSALFAPDIFPDLNPDNLKYLSKAKSIVINYQDGWADAYFYPNPTVYSFGASFSKYEYAPENSRLGASKSGTNMRLGWPYDSATNANPTLLSSPTLGTQSAFTPAIDPRTGEKRIPPYVNPLTNVIEKASTPNTPTSPSYFFKLE